MTVSTHVLSTQDILKTVSAKFSRYVHHMTVQVEKDPPLDWLLPDAPPEVDPSAAIVSAAAAAAAVKQAAATVGGGHHVAAFQTNGNAPNDAHED